jgi:hypothetical protein
VAARFSLEPYGSPERADPQRQTSVRRLTCVYHASKYAQRALALVVGPVPLVVGVCLQPAGGLAMAFGCLIVAKGVRRRRRLALAARGPLVPRRRTVVRPLSFAACVAIVVSQHDGGYRAPDPAVAPARSSTRRRLPTFKSWWPTGASSRAQRIRRSRSCASPPDAPVQASYNGGARLPVWSRPSPSRVAPSQKDRKQRSDG